MKMKKALSMLLLFALVLGSLVGCGGQSDDVSGEKKMKSDLHIVPKEISSNLDIVMNTADEASMMASGSIFEQLLQINSNYEPVKELCEDFTVNNDNTEYIYQLRKGIMFHNGQEMKADDVVASMNRWIEAAGNVKTMVGGSHFEKVDDYTVKISMANPCPYLNILIASYSQRPAIMPKSVVENVDPATGLVTEYIGTGPYKMDEWVEDQYVKLTRFDEYTPYGTPGDFSGWVGYKAAETQNIYFDFVTDASTIMAGLQTGEYDATLGISYDSYDTFAEDENYNVELEVTQMPMMIFNKKEGLATDNTFRRAIAAGLDMSEILYAAYGDEKFFELNSSYMFESQPAWYSEAGGQCYNEKNPDKAKQLLKEAGYNGEPFTILVSSDSQDFYSMAVVIKDQLEKIGVKTELLLYDWSTFVSIRNNEPDKYNAFITAFSAKGLPSMNLFLSPTWAGWVNDPRILGDLGKIDNSGTLEEGVAIWNELQKYMWEESMPVIKFGVQKMFMTSTAKVEGMTFFERISFVNAKVYE